jgi:beta-glucuronidase
MKRFSRRRFVAAASPALGTVAFTKPTGGNHAAQEPEPARPAREFDLCTVWRFRTDPDSAGEKNNWSTGESAGPDWRSVMVPHTWQIDPPFVEYRGDAWYTKSFLAPADWEKRAVRIEFEAVFHSATVWVNGKLAGRHLRKGYTAFTLDMSHLLQFEKNNVVAVRVNNAFDEHMLPRGRSSDWAHDGGIFRPVRLLITDKVYAERVDVEAVPNFENGSAELTITPFLQSAMDGAISGTLQIRVIDEETGDVVISDRDATPFHFSQSGPLSLSLQRQLQQAKLWHFDSPKLYRLEMTTRTADTADLFTTTFGVRRFEVRDGAFYLNNEKLALTGVERMAGSNPEFGMAEPYEWIQRDHQDLKYLNCVFSRVHWPQDKRVLEYCDRHGILMQEEVPTWGPNTFRNMSSQPDADIMQNGLEQLHEMVARDRNHPCIVSWGLCNEIGGQNPPAYNFAKNMLAEAKKINPSRLCSYASHSLFKDQAKDVSGLMDFIECNQYIGSWQQGGPADLERLMDEIHSAFPDKPIVISEYGYCACTADRPEGDGHRVAVLSWQNAVLRSKPFVAGAIFFCYNDYRTHVGDRGEGVLKQRVHGVVDVYGKTKPSYRLLRNESGPIESLTFENFPSHVLVHAKNRSDLPSYTLRGYTLRALFYEFGDIPVKRVELPLPVLAPGAQATLQFDFEVRQPERITFDVLRPTQFSVSTLEWLR